MIRPALPLVLAAVLLGLTLGAATVLFEAKFESRNAVALGQVQTMGQAWAAYQPARSNLPAPTSPLFSLQGADVRVIEEYQDYLRVGGYVVPGLAEIPAIGKDVDPPQRVEHPLGAAQLGLHQARNEVRFLVVPLDAAPLTVEASSTSLGVDPLPRIAVSLWDDRGTMPNPYFERKYARDGASLQVSTDTPSGPVVIRGDFRVYAWDLDVTPLADSSQVYPSGILITDGPGKTDETPHGAYYQARFQVLTMEVRGGEFSYAVPGRPVLLFFGSEMAQVSNMGSWDLQGGSGQLTWNGFGASVSEAPVEFRGQFSTQLGVRGDGERLQTQWTGQAQSVSVNNQLLVPGVAKAAPAGFLSLSPPWILALGLVATGTGGWFALRVRHAHAGRTPSVRIAGALEAGDFQRTLKESERALARQAQDEEAQVARGIALLKLGRAQDVVATYEPGFDAKAPMAAVQAYLLSLAHLELGHVGAGAQWILAAVSLFPDFSHEIQENDAFAPLRTDARIRKLLGEPVREDASYV